MVTGQATLVLLFFVAVEELREIMSNIPALPEDEVADGYVGFYTTGMQAFPQWSIRRLWALAADLPIQYRPLHELETWLELKPGWFADQAPTLRELAYHSQRIATSDLQHPIILSAEGYILDGKHRLAKAWILQLSEVAVVQFHENPTPDFWEPVDPE
jgi:hypothetical protein